MLGIVGTGVSGLRVCAELIEGGYNEPIVAWDAENREPYDRTHLSKDLFHRYFEPLAAQGYGDLAELGVQVRHLEVRSIQQRSSAVSTGLPTRAESSPMWMVTDDEGTTEVDTLVIASGTSVEARIPGALRLQTAQDAEDLLDALQGAHRVAILGAGWTGTELASALTDAGIHVDMYSASGHVLRSDLPGVGDAVIGAWMQQAGVGLHQMPPHTPALEGYDVVIQAFGSRPNTQIVEPFADLTPSGTIVTTLAGQVLRDGTPVPGLYASGDCASALDPDGGFLAGNHWNRCLGQASRTAAAVLGNPLPARLEPAEIFSTQFGHEVSLVGTLPKPADAPDTHERTSEGESFTWTDADGTLIAAFSYDSPRDVSKARKALRRKIS
ncbi:MAG: FAD-dependent oxidoreductase [Actinomycetaceae bacterium]|nr:FAD-dependent oxidoreductase [Actinomycetaceae bacterium]MDY6082906.1 FAD-dependent oxidoreductase [Actinomycetaceae bacterium]